MITACADPPREPTCRPSEPGREPGADAEGVSRGTGRFAAGLAGLPLLGRTWFAIARSGFPVRVNVDWVDLVDLALGDWVVRGRGLPGPLPPLELLDAARALAFPRAPTVAPPPLEGFLEIAAFALPALLEATFALVFLLDFATDTPTPFVLQRTGARAAQALNQRVFR